MSRSIAGPPVEVTARGFGWRYAGRRAWAVRDLDLTIGAGERVLLLGASGAGKSTVLAAFAGLLADDSGERAGTVSVGGRDPREARAEVGMLFQDPQTSLVLERSGDDVAFGLENHGVPTAEIWSRVDSALAEVGFPYPRERPTHALSGGEQQRLALAGALVMRPGLLLLDEPTANLDPLGADLVRTLLKGLTGQTMVLVEHRVAEAVPLVDRVIVISPDGVLADGDPERVFAAHGADLAAQGVWVPGATGGAPRRAMRPRGDTLLRADGVGFRHRGSTVPVPYGIDLEIAEGEVLAVRGPNGAGKSTLALLLGGLLRPTHGDVTATAALAGGDARTPPWRWRAATLAGHIGSVFQSPEHQFVTSRVRDEIALGGVPAETVDDLLTRLRLERLAEANPWTLSGGEARRLSVATALARAPGLLVLDEPTFGQDRRTWWELIELTARLRDDGRGIVVVTHDGDLVDVLADRELHL
ncbi:ABC transporter ATP-binding protein [Virgisporangium aliadipatigenens]|uniref:ABC transporter ATP-binding protein n=1 Tax=Virgisporangium aliadipatigenens TaxID=741659 RepID=A0A8J3YKJ1_9ACTN|nr:ATP-binding cassette domain-containing protein [Virgisporangium aliadipatigenens]GIJ47114.1 ABC transporter ATP-binding protein [Virgisporangium aliadipatigenens]